MIHLGVGQPDPALLPVTLFKEAAAHHFNLNDGALLAYGAERGDGRLLHALAQFLTDGYGMPVQDNELFITNGISQGVDWVCHCFTQPGDTVFVEEPTYHLVPQILRDRGLNIIPIPIDEQGMNIDILEEKLKKHQPAFIYTIPVFHNPATVTLSADRRRRLVALSQEHDFLIVADEVYQLLNYTTTPPPPMPYFDESGTVLSLGTFSKILAPGLRLGWIQAAPALIERLIDKGIIDSGGGLNPFTAGIVYSALELGLQQSYLTRLKATYQERIEALCNGLRQHLPPSVTFEEPQGGFFVWVQLPEGMDARDLLPEAQRQQVGFQPGVKFSANQGLQNYMRLSFAFYDVDNLREGAKRLGKVLHRFLEDSPK